MGDLEIFRMQSFGGSIGFGRKPALIVVDFTVGFNTRLFGGGIAAAVQRAAGLLGFCRDAGLPIAFTRLVMPTTALTRRYADRCRLHHFRAVCAPPSLTP